MIKWEEIIEDYVEYIDRENANPIIVECKTDMLLKKLYFQLLADNEALKCNNEISICAIHTPSLRGNLDKKNRFAHRLCQMIFPHNEEDKIHAYIRFGRFLTHLRTRYRKQVMDAEKKRMENKKHTIDSCTLNRPISDEVINPKAMPVNVALLKELEPFFSHMKNNVPSGTKELEFTRGVHYDDGRIDLCKQVVGSSWICNLMDSIRNNPHVDHFLLGNNIIDIVGANAIGKFISSEHVPKIKTWYIAGNRITTEGIQIIGEALEQDTDAEALWLKRNPLMPIGGMYIGEMLQANNTLQILDLENTGLLDEGIEYLTLGLKNNTRLRKLYLGSNGITIKGAESLAGYFDILTEQKRKGITSLYITCNRLKDGGIQVLAEALKNYEHLKRLAVGSNRITWKGSDILLDALTNSPNLTCLSFGTPKATFAIGEIPNLISDQGAVQIAKFIKNNKHIKLLDIGGNRITNNGLLVISKALENNDVLLDLKYQQPMLKIDAKVDRTIQNKLRNNVKNNLNMTQDHMYQNYLRFIKHTKKVVNIDSVYRTRDFK